MLVWLLEVFFFVCGGWLVWMLFIALLCRRWKAGREQPIDKENLMKDMEEQEAFPENFSNELYNPVEEVANLSSTFKFNSNVNSWF